jgi:hypothetical protein
MSLPTMTDFMRKRELRSVGNLVQTVCLRARARAIAQREIQHLIFFVNAGTYNVGAPYNFVVNNGAARSIHFYDSNSSTPATGDDNQPVDEDPVSNWTELAQFDTPGGNFNLVFHIDGTIEFGGAITDEADDPETSDDTDMVINQTGSDAQCFIDVVANTGRVQYVVRYPE